MIAIPENINKPIIGKETILISAAFGKILNHRIEAIPLKEKLRFNIKNNIPTKLNFKGVIYSSPSFMDECIAKTLITAGEDHFNRKVSITYANKQVKDMISYVIQERIKLYLTIN